MKLLVVESPAKCKKIQDFLGAAEWRVQATMGHIRALKEELTAIGFDAAKGTSQTWHPVYETLDSKARAIAALRKAAKEATAVYLGSDDDREGEAIAWHTCAVLGLDPKTTPRVTFHEITAPALRAAVAAPRLIDFNKFNAQQARTMLDLLIGFTLSPCLWRAVGFKPGLSAGRCQTPALRLIYDRDRLIETHTAETSWNLTVSTGADADTLLWAATAPLESEAAASTAIQQLTAKPQTLTITGRKERVATHKPPLPFITSSLQQEASSRLGLQPKATMRAAQTLYEGGHITYMRTDNPTLSQEAQEAAAAIVRARWGEEYLGAVVEGTVVKKVKKKAAAAAEPQAAHEGIRPTHMEHEEAPGVSDTEQRLYKLIWLRTIQSVMAAEERDTVTATATPTPIPTLATLEATWDQTRFAGWRILETERKAESEAADTAAYATRSTTHTVGAAIPWTQSDIKEQRTAPPSRYTEASLIRELESRGIGRPSTYATLVETVLEREYVEKSVIAAQPITLRGFSLKAGGSSKPRQTTRTEKIGGERDKLRTTPLGRTVIEWLLGQFGDIMDYDFTAAMESQLDDVAKGGRAWNTVLSDTWSRYSDRYASVMSSSGSAPAPPRKGDLGDGYKVIVCKKGTLFVHEVAGQNTRFAAVPPALSVATATRADAEAAFAAAAAAHTGVEMGVIDGIPVQRKTGKFGPYVVWGDRTLSCKESDTLADLEVRLKAVPETTVDRTVGAYRIKRGAYGLYMYKIPPPGSTTKPVFVGIPDTTPWVTLTAESADAIYKHALTAKREAKTAKKSTPK